MQQNNKLTANFSISEKSGMGTVEYKRGLNILIYLQIQVS